MYLRYYAEFGCESHSEDDECFIQKQKFSSIPATMWWCIVTMTTVGYGDMYPTTGIGKIIAVPTMLAGILIFALPITVIGSNYETAYHNEVRSRVVSGHPTTTRCIAVSGQRQVRTLASELRLSGGLA